MSCDEREKTIPASALLLCIGAMVGLHYTVPLLQWGSCLSRDGGAVMVVLGLGMNVWSALHFRRNRTTISPLEHSTHLARVGLYRISRNPMYLGMLCTLVGVALGLGSLAPVVMVAVFVGYVQSQFIRGEEARLEQVFGEEYRQYKREVRRWL